MHNQAHGTNAAHVSASPNAARLVRAAASHWPRTKSAKLVVPPQLGQGMPNNHRTVQGGRPNCWCVPNPRGSGSTRVARTKPVTTSRLAARSKPRCSDDREPGCECGGITGGIGDGARFISPARWGNKENRPQTAKRAGRRQELPGWGWRVPTHSGQFRGRTPIGWLFRDCEETIRNREREDPQANARRLIDFASLAHLWLRP